MNETKPQKKILYEWEISNLPDIEFKVIIIKEAH